MTWLALDIGGANLKAADGLGWARGVSFELWRDPAGLTAALLELIGSAPKCDRLLVTMTGELCDCFRTKAEGVRHILNAAQQSAGGREIGVYLVDGRIASIDVARELAQLAAASNWHALARFACRFTDGSPGLLIDIGSTTTDIVPLSHGRVAATGTDDTERLLAGELVYTGVGRTPICAVTGRLPWRGEMCPVAAELFATTADAYLLLDEMDAMPTATWTADGRPLTKKHARERLARMVCADSSTFSESDTLRAAEFIREVQLAQLSDAATRIAARVESPLECVVVSGSGEFLAGQLANRVWPDMPIVAMSEILDTKMSRCAPAHALAVLARELE